MKKQLGTLLLISVLSTTGCLNRAFTDLDDGSSAKTHRFPASPGTDIELAVGDTMLLTGSDLEVTFSSVAADSRCPSDVVCFWTGQARIILSVNSTSSAGYQVEATIPGLTPTPLEENDPIEVGEFTLRLLRLNPYPTENAPSGTGAYRALFRIES